MRTPAIIVLGASALPLAQKLSQHMQGEVHGPSDLPGCDIAYGKATSHILHLFEHGRDVIGICAAAILIRAVAASVTNKLQEPALISVSENGEFVVPLIGGHHGANALARRIATITGGVAAITTASDVVLGVSLDVIPDGYSLATPDLVKPVTAKLLTGSKLKFNQAPADWLLPVAAPGGDIPAEVSVNTAKPGVLTYHPKSLVVGLGCERGTSVTEVSDLLQQTLRQHDLAAQSIACFATIDVKEDEPALNAMGDVRYFTAQELDLQTPRVSSPSEAVRAEVGTPSVAEAAALAAAGPDAKLIVTKQKSKRATIAIAQAPAPILVPQGRARGILHIVGLGPGAAAFRSPTATQALADTHEWVGYGLYLDLAKDQYTDQNLHDFPLGGEEDRCRHAIALAKSGKRVALICSGDAAIYAMAALVYELIDREPCRIAIEVHPGISAFQLASARVGALIGHDFCCISLSDLLTPWQAIEKRIKAAAEADFVVAFYNPRSMKRTDQIARAFACLTPYRHDETPVILASNLGRPEESVRVIRLRDFRPEEVDMLTVVLVGSSQSKIIMRGDGKASAYTPRGYARKMDAA